MPRAAGLQPCRYLAALDKPFTELAFPGSGTRGLTPWAFSEGLDSGRKAVRHRIVAPAGIPELGLAAAGAPCDVSFFAAASV
jgi:hypothetical protein